MNMGLFLGSVQLKPWSRIGFLLFMESPEPEPEPPSRPLSGALVVLIILGGFFAATMDGAPKVGGHCVPWYWPVPGMMAFNFVLAGVFLLGFKVLRGIVRVNRSAWASMVWAERRAPVVAIEEVAQRVDVDQLRVLASSACGLREEIGEARALPVDLLEPLLELADNIDRVSEQAAYLGRLDPRPLGPRLRRQLGVHPTAIAEALAVDRVLAQWLVEFAKPPQHPVRL